MRVVRYSVLAATLCVLPRLHAQGDATTDRATAAESTATRRSAERAARTFEQRRLRLLPDVPSSGSGPGDVIIGRYRYTAGEADKLTPPPAEPAVIAKERWSLLKTLDSASRAMPCDEWVRGRLVWYSIEAGDTAAAVAAARRCRDDELPWWCDALLGLALHASHDFVMAERAFDRAVAAMPDSTRCRWTDASPLLDGEAQKLVRRTPCEHRASLDQRLWWLADPLHSVEGNELRSEHFARRTFTVLHDRWRASHPLGWGADMREIVLRYAWPVAWSRDRTSERSPTQSGFSMALTGHEPNPAYDFFPDAQALEAPYQASDANWRLKRSRAQSHYAHPFAAPIRPLPHQIAQFRRGDSLLIVAGWDASDDTLFNRGSGSVAMVVSRDDGQVRFMERSDSAAANGVLVVAVPDDDYVASLELFARDSRAVARTRAGLRAPSVTSGVALSDILLLEPGEPPRSFEEALRRLLPDGELGADRRVTLYWEVYGIGTADRPRVTVSVSRMRASRTRRLAEKLGLRDEPQTAQIQWETDAPVARSAAGSVTLDLRDRPAGTWRVSITVTEGGGGTASAARDLVIDGR
jgi:hypothetical protein